MYQILKNRITAGGFQLTDIQRKARKLYAMGELTDEQLDELIALSQQNASPEAEQPETLAMLRNLAARVAAIEKKMAPQADPETELPEYEAWEPWDGISDKHQMGAVVSHKGSLWQSLYEGQNVWEPGTAGTENLWVEYTPETEEE